VSELSSSVVNMSRQFAAVGNKVIEHDQRIAALETH
jgi:hypothetical protein